MSVPWSGSEAGGFGADFSGSIWTLEVFGHAGRPIHAIKKRLPESQCTALSEVRESVVSEVFLPHQFLQLQPSSERQAVEVICALHVALIFFYLIFIHVLLNCKTADETDFSL